MAAVIGADYESVKKAVSKVNIGVLAIANWNSREQIVVAGHKEAVEELVSRVDAFKTVIIPVSAPFTCELMKGAEKKLAYDLDYIEFKDLKFPIITNVDAEVIRTGNAARDALKRQVSRTVLWHKSMEILEKEKVDHAIELGSSKVLSALMKRTSRRWTPRPVLLNVEDTESLVEAQKILK
jgi:[acyl-carrier-protein] S-malonyltransferase